MKQITFELSSESSKNFINSLATGYWHKNKSRFFRKEHNCSLLMKVTSDTMKFIIISTHNDYTSFMINHLENQGINYQYETNLDNTEEYEFIVAKEVDQIYTRNLNLQIGASRAELIRERYFSSHTKQFTEKLELVLKKIAKYEFEFSFLIATSYLEEIINEAFKQNFDLKRFKQFQDKVNTVLTLSFKIEFLYANGFFDEKTLEVLNRIRKIRNHLAHQSILEKNHSSSIDSHIEIIKNTCDNGIISRQETIEGVKDKRLLVLIPIVENLCIAIIGATYFTNPSVYLGGVRYSNKGYGRGFFYTHYPEYMSIHALQSLESKYRNLKFEQTDFRKHGFNLKNF